jgi:hypothetical protein
MSSRQVLARLEVRLSLVDRGSPPVDEGWVFCDEGCCGGNAPVLSVMAVAMSVS